MPSMQSYYIATPRAPDAQTGLFAHYKMTAGNCYTNTGLTVVATDGQSVGGVRDLSGNGRHLTQAGGGSQAVFRAGASESGVTVLNGRPVLDFSPGFYYYDTNWTALASQQYTVFAVYSHGGTTPTDSYILGGDQIDNGQLMLGITNTQTVELSQWNNGITSNAGAPTLRANGAILSAVRSNANRQLYYNGELVKGSANGTLLVSNLNQYVGRQASYGNHFRGFLTELIVYTGALSRARHQAILRYLATQYAIPLYNPQPIVSPSLLRGRYTPLWFDPFLDSSGMQSADPIGAPNLSEFVTDWGYPFDTQNGTAVGTYANKRKNYGNASELQAYDSTGISVSTTGTGTLTLSASSIASTPYTNNGGISYNALYNSGMISTAKFPNNYGQFYAPLVMEARILQAATGSGTANTGYWSGFWLTSSALNKSYLWQAEIDATEVYTDPREDKFNTHFVNNWNMVTTPNASNNSSLNAFIGNYPGYTTAPNAYRTITCEYRPEQVTWFVDGVQRYRTTTTQVIPFSWVYMILNLAVEASAGVPFSMAVDYWGIWGATENVVAYNV